MNYTDVDTDRVLRVKSQIDGDIAAITRNRDVFRSEIISALEPYWQGKAKDSFTAQFNAFIPAFDSFVQGCGKLNDQLETAAKAYNKADSEARQTVGNIPD